MRTDSMEPLQDHSQFTIETRRDRKRGCGWRQPGGLYLVGPKLSEPCGRLPRPLAACPTCGGGFHRTRGWTWIDPGAIFDGTICTSDADPCDLCPLHTPANLPLSGLLWIGRTYYPQASSFIEEAVRLGVSRRIPHLPIRFAIGQTVVFLAHEKVCLDPNNGEPGAGIFATFIPTAIDYVVKGTETPDRLEGLLSHGVNLVKIERIEQEPTLPHITAP
jgi:hypothetical protein